MAANGLLRYVLSSAFPLFTVQREWLLLGPSISSQHHHKHTISILACPGLERAMYY